MTHERRDYYIAKIPPLTLAYSWKNNPPSFTKGQLIDETGKRGALGEILFLAGVPEQIKSNVSAPS